MVSTVFNFKSNLKRVQVLEYINALNSDFVFMKAYVEEENTLIIETFLEGVYDRTNFSLLIDNIEYDMRIFGENELTEHYLE